MINGVYNLIFFSDNCLKVVTTFISSSSNLFQLRTHMGPSTGFIHVRVQPLNLSWS